MLSDNDLKSYIKSYLEDRKISYTRLDKHDRAIEVLINENERLNNIIKEAKEEIEYFELQAKHLDDNIYLDEKLTNKLLEILKGSVKE